MFLPLQQLMPSKLISSLILPLILASASAKLRNHYNSLDQPHNDPTHCNLLQKTTVSFNNNCLFRYTICEGSPNQIKSNIDCTYCQGQKNCPYLKYLAEPECIEKCCPFQSFFLSSMSGQRLQSCILFTQMERKSINWVHNEFFFPFLIALIVLLIIIVIFLLIKTVVHLWSLYVKRRKRNEHEHPDENHDNTTQENEHAHQWAFEY